MVRATQPADRVKVPHPSGGEVEATLADGWVTMLIDTPDGRKVGMMLYDSEGNAILCQLDWQTLGIFQRNMNGRAIEIDPRGKRD